MVEQYIADGKYRVSKDKPSHSLSILCLLLHPITPSIYYFPNSHPPLCSVFSKTDERGRELIEKVRACLYSFYIYH